MDFSTIQLDDDLTYDVEPVAILGHQVRKLRSKDIASVKVQWRGRPMEEAIWDTEREMWSRYPHLFEASGHEERTCRMMNGKAKEVDGIESGEGGVHAGKRDGEAANIEKLKGDARAYLNAKRAGQIEDATGSKSDHVVIDTQVVDQDGEDANRPNDNMQQEATLIERSVATDRVMPAEISTLAEETGKVDKLKGDARDFLNALELAKSTGTLVDVRQLMLSSGSSSADTARMNRGRNETDMNCEKVMNADNAMLSSHRVADAADAPAFKKPQANFPRDISASRALDTIYKAVGGRVLAGLPKGLDVETDLIGLPEATAVVTDASGQAEDGKKIKGVVALNKNCDRVTAAEKQAVTLITGDVVEPSAQAVQHSMGVVWTVANRAANAKKHTIVSTNIATTKITDDISFAVARGTQLEAKSAGVLQFTVDPKIKTSGHLKGDAVATSLHKTDNLGDGFAGYSSEEREQEVDQYSAGGEFDPPVKQKKLNLQAPAFPRNTPTTGTTNSESGRVVQATETSLKQATQATSTQMVITPTKTVQQHRKDPNILTSNHLGNSKQ
ncbi:uncharacterized protein [Nicotiana sylvestris]|uniref:uncharacterized protein n=1 Tax=Nicotiana sylvestris TaxID=4096 RepID=UPI00388C82B4